MESRVGGARPLLVAFLLAACSAAPSAAPASSPTAIATTATTPTLALPPTAPATAIPTPTARTSDGVWRQVPTSPQLAAIEFTDITWNGARFVAIGHNDPTSISLGGTFLDSVDGLEWNIQVPAGGAWNPTSIAAGRGGSVAIGWVGDHFVSFTSPDGMLWTPHPDAFPMPDLGTDSVQLTDIAWVGEGWIVVGRRDEACDIDCGGTPKRSYVWTSPNGVNWTRVADQASLNGGGMNAITKAGAGYVAAGVSNWHAAIWSSPDGRTWSRVPDAPMFGSNPELPVIASGAAEVLDTYVVVGSALAQDICDPALKDADCPGVRAWWSTNGTTWTKGTIAGARDGQARGVATATAGYLILGLAGGCPGGIGRSMDGRSWGCDTKDPALNHFTPTAAFASDTTEVVVGTTFSGDVDGAPAPAGTIWYRVGA